MNFEEERGYSYKTKKYFEKNQSKARLATNDAFNPMYRLILVWSVLALFFLANRIQAQDLDLGKLSVGGTGCSEANTESVIEETETGLDIKVQFYNYYVEKEESGLKRASCSLALPIKVPAGMQIEIQGASLVSLVGLEASDKVTINGEIFLAGDRGTPESLTLEGPVLDFKTVEIPSQVTSQCGDDVILRANTSILLRKSSKDWGFGLIDTLLTHVVIKKC